MNRACFLRKKTPEFTKMGEIHEFFILALSLVWFAGATPERIGPSKVFAVPHRSARAFRKLPIIGDAPERFKSQYV